MWLQIYKKFVRLRQKATENIQYLIKADRRGGTHGNAILQYCILRSFFRWRSGKRGIIRMIIWFNIQITNILYTISILSHPLSSSPESSCNMQYCNMAAPRPASPALRSKTFCSSLEKNLLRRGEKRPQKALIVKTIRNRWFYTKFNVFPWK